MLMLVGLGVIGAGASSRAAEFPFVVDMERSRVEVDVKAVLHSFTAKVSPFQAEFFVDSATNRVTRGVLHLKFSDIKTGNDKRDAAMHEWQNTTQFPDAVFTLVSVTALPSSRFEAKGNLRFHGTGKELVFPVAIESGNLLRYTVSGQVPLDVREFGLPAIRKYLLKVDPVVQVRFHLQGSIGK